jgi:hypothetical protein
MTFSVGVLYSSQELLNLIGEKHMSPDEFCASFKTFAVASASDVLDIAQRCNWVALSMDGRMVVTARGQQLLETPTREAGLRLQIKHAIEVLQPAWAQRMRNGREEVRGYLPTEIRQCFNEAGLMDEWDDPLIDWWDGLAQAARAKKNDELLLIGRKAERLSWEYELIRTKTRPRWQALESNFSGFDLLSRIDELDEEPLRIEVKGTTLSRREAWFYLTRNEWKVAVTSGNYRFHIWLLSHNPPALIEKDHTQVFPHVPSDKGCGQWWNVQIRVAEL